MNSTTKCLIVFFCVLCTTMPVQSQNKVIDSLETVLKSHKARDTTRVNLLNTLANSYCSIDIDKALLFIKESKEILSTINYTKGKATVIYLKGLVLESQSSYEESAKHYKNALTLFKSIDFKKGISDCLNGLGGISDSQSNHNEAISYFNKVIEINKSIGNLKEVAVGFNNIGIVYTSQGNFNEAIIYFKKALKNYTDADDIQGVAVVTNNIGIISHRQGNYPLSLEYFQKGLTVYEKSKNALKSCKSLMNIGVVYVELQDYDKAIEFNNRAIKIAIKNDSKKDIATITSNLGIVYHKKKEYQTSFEYLKKALELSKEINFKMQIGLCLNNLGDVHLSLKNYAEALNYFNQAKTNNLENKHQLSLTHSYLGIAKVYTHYKVYDKALVNAIKGKELSNNLKLLDYERDIEQLLSTIYKNTGRYKKALTSHEQFKKLNDSLFNKKSIQKITAIEYEYKYKQERDSAKIKELKLNKTIQLTETDLAKSEQNLLFGIIIFLVIALVMGAFIFFLKLRNEKAKTQNIAIEQKLLRLQMTPHFIFNSLSVLQGMIYNKEQETSILYLSKFSKLLRTILENSRHKTVFLSEELSAIDDYMAIQNLDEIPPYKYTLKVASEIDTATLKIPPMLIQPFIENAIEHAFKNNKEDKEIIVTLTFKNKKLTCTIADNGIGIDLEKQKIQKDKNSLATTITSERLKILSKDFKMEGTIDVKNKELLGKQGTLVTLVIPYKIDSL